MTGAALVCTFSVKFVGLFVILFVGVSTVYDLWALLGDVTQSCAAVARHLLARVLCLILLPLALYTSFFLLHFLLLSRAGQGSAHFGPRFQSSLAGNEYEGAEVRRYVQYGSVITLKGSNNFPCAYLHSHHHQVNIVAIFKKYL